MVMLITEDRLRSGCIAVITLNRPENKNAINRQLARELSSCLQRLVSDKKLRVVIITGAGDAFSAGVDLQDPVFADPEMMTSEWMRGPGNYLWQMQQMKVPLIAAVNGACITGGMEIALQCDLIVASTSALFRDTHTTFGIPPAGGMSQILQRMVGVQRARFMSLTGAKVDGATAASWGLACEVVEPDRLMDRAIKIAEMMLKKDSTVTSLFRKLINEGQGRSLQSALDWEVDQVMDRYREMGKEGKQTHSRLSEAFRAEQRSRARAKL
mmetsp:Transcript_14401/g.34110  ORF Transcript_14401/g.34110 Transcript_14401/m.34110 type:complete len:269 (-) Transcript_14401:129-935(-)